MFPMNPRPLLLLISVTFPGASLALLLAPSGACQLALGGFPEPPPMRGQSGADDPGDCPDGPGRPAGDPSAKEILQQSIEQEGRAAPACGAPDPHRPRPVARFPGAFQVLRL